MISGRHPYDDGQLNAAAELVTLNCIEIPVLAGAGAGAAAVVKHLIDEIHRFIALL